MRGWILAALAALWAGQAGAAVYRYIYTGQVLELVSTDNPPVPPTLEALTLSILIDEALIPGGSLVDYALPSWGGTEGDPLPDGILRVTGNYGVRFPSFVYSAFDLLVFDADRQIVRWRIVNDLAGPDVLSGMGGDSYYDFVSYYRSAGPGTWSVRDVTPVPLPAGGLLLAGAVVAFALRRRS